MSVDNKKKQLVIKAVGELGGRVTVSDIVARTGFAVYEVAALINSIAADTLSTLEVGREGNIFYCFPANLPYHYLKHGLIRFLERLFTVFGSVLYFIFRISFGLILLFSLACFGLIVLGIEAIVAGLSNSGELVALQWANLANNLTVALRRDISALFRRGHSSLPSQPLETPSFLLNCHTFLFGEANPNSRLTEEQWRLIAQVIHLNEGVITAEHIAPYTGKDPQNEKEMFEVMAKFDGHPVVSESGNIVYVFPTMKVRSAKTSYAEIPAYLEAIPYEQVNFGDPKFKPILLLALINFCASILFWLFFSATFRHGHPNWLFGFLAVYGILFLIIPLMRRFVVHELNHSIESYNKRVKDFEHALGNPNQELMNKLEDAEHFRKAALTHEELVYSTNRDMLEQLIETKLSNRGDSEPTS